MIAYLDESIRTRDRLYIVTASLVTPRNATEVREVLRRIPPGRSRRFHWRTEQEPSRLRMVDAIRDLQLRTFAACYCSEHSKWSKRGRVQALKGLLWKLREADLGVDHLVIETRGEPGDKDDRRTIYRAQRSGHADPAITYTFESSLNPLLWVPDAIAGVVSA